MRLRVYQLLAINTAIICAGLMNARPTSSDELKAHCIEGEREALLKFMQNFGNTSDRLSYWSSEIDCCKWKEVRCNSTTGRVISLDVNSSFYYYKDNLRGEINSSLLGLPYLSFLDLSYNDFMNTQVPEFLGSLLHLEHLNLSCANFSGTIPYQLGNLSSLQSLHLSCFDYPYYSLTVNNLDWLHGLSSLKVLDLSGVQLGSVENWHDALFMVPSLVVLRLAFCQLSNHPLGLPYVNISSLEILDLGGNFFNITIPNWVFESGYRLQHLDLHNNIFQGRIPDKFKNMSSLAILDISFNNLIGSIPSTLCQLAGQRNSSLKELYLSENHLNDTLDKCLVQFSRLVILDLSQNNFEGVITDTYLDKFKNLKMLSLSSNHMTINVKKDWVPSFQLEYLYLRHCQLGHNFPRWLQSQKNLNEIDISDNNISGVVPDWFWNFSLGISSLDLSYNLLTGFLPDLSLHLSLWELDLSQNNFSGPLPPFSPKLATVVLRGNSFFGSISPICNIVFHLQMLDLSLNNLSGKVPNCWSYGQMLIMLNLADNDFSGAIPDSFGSLINLEAMSLGGNNISGKIPLSLKNCRRLVLFDLGHNQLSGTIPSWIGEELKNLKAIFLSSNAFKGYIPLQFCQLKKMGILDLSLNQLTGVIPQCVFPNMDVKGALYYPFTLSDKSILFHYYWKRKYSVYSGDYAGDWALNSLKVIDLSSNFLTGGIPKEITRHVELKSLNVSINQLTGFIPSNIGEMKSLEVLDLSRNQLSSSIPASITTMDELQVLDVSYNNLSGEIPTGNHLDTFDCSSYMGNPHLCEHPLTFICPIEEPLQNSFHGQGQAYHWDWEKIHPFYLSIVLGFITGFWGLWGSLLLNRSWRHAYLSFLTHTCDKIYVLTAIVMAKLRQV